jgi:hypothetical protein
MTPIIYDNTSTCPTGGDGTCGVVLERTILASPQVSLPILILTFETSSNLTSELWIIMVDNSLKWAGEGWGGYSTVSTAKAVVYLNPRLLPDESRVAMKPLLDFGVRLQSENNATTALLFTEFCSWNAFWRYLQVNSLW